MTRFPLIIILEMHDKNKSINTPLDIQRSKDTMQILHDSKVGNTNHSLVLSTILGKRSCLNYCLDGKLNLVFCF